MSSSDWIAAGAAIAAAGVVAWQSWETRRSANASTEAAEVANAALEYSRSALELARAEESNTRRLIDEAVKTRIDEATPTITVVLGVMVGPLQPSVLTEDGLQFVKPGNVYRLPKHQHERLVVRQFFTLISHGDRVMVTEMPEWTPYVDETIYPDAVFYSQSGPYEVPPGARQEGYFHVDRSIAEWVKIAEEGHDSARLSPYDFIIEYADPSDTGAIDHYVIRTSGAALVAVPDELGAWLVPEGLPVSDGVHPGLSSKVLPRIRKYYLSKLEDRQLE